MICRFLKGFGDRLPNDFADKADRPGWEIQRPRRQHFRLAQSNVESVESAEAFVFRIATNLLRDRWRRDQVRRAYRVSVEGDMG